MAPTLLDHSPRTRALRQLRQWLAAGEIPLGERLPAEQVVADRLKVSRGTVRAALKTLAGEGLLHGRVVLGGVPSASSAPSALMANTVVLLSAHADASNRYRGSGYSAAVDVGAMDALHATGRALMALPPDGLSDATVTELIRQRPRGVLVPLRASERSDLHAPLARLRAAGIPVVVSTGETALADFDRVEHDHRAGARLLTEWLIARGRKRPCFVCKADRRRQWVRERLAGSDAATRAAHLKPCEPLWLVGRMDTAELPADEDFLARTRQFAGFLVDRLRGSQMPDALLVASDGDCYAVAAALRLLGRKPQRDIWLVGYDAYWQSVSDHAYEPSHPLATIDKDNQGMGAELVRLLDARLTGRLPAIPQRVVMPPRLVEIARAT